MTKWAFSQAEAGNLKKDIEAALKEVADKHGLTFAWGNRGTISTTGFGVKVELNKTTADGQDATAIEEFNRAAWRYDLRPEDYGTEFSYAGRKLKLVRINTRARAWPFECEGVGGTKGARLPPEAADIIKMATDKATA